MSLNDELDKILSGAVHEDGMKAARQYARWHIGSPSWADTIVDAYLNPQQAMVELERMEALRRARRNG